MDPEWQVPLEADLIQALVDAKFKVLTNIVRQLTSTLVQDVKVANLSGNCTAKLAIAFDQSEIQTQMSLEEAETIILATMISALEKRSFMVRCWKEGDTWYIGIKWRRPVDDKKLAAYKKYIFDRECSGVEDFMNSEGPSEPLPNNQVGMKSNKQRTPGSQ